MPSSIQERSVQLNKTDATGKLVAQSLPFGQDQLKTTYNYGSQGLISSVNALGQTTTTAYANVALELDGTMSQLQRTTKVVEPDGREVWSYADPNGRVVKQVEQSVDKERTTTFGYNPLGQMILKQVTSNGKTETTRFGYDGAGHLSYLQDDLGQVHTYVYNSMGKVIAVYINGTLEKSSTFNELGWTLSKTNAAGSLEKYKYKVNGLVDTYTDKAGQKYQYTYTKYNEQDRVSIRNAQDQEIWWTQNTYDPLTRLLTGINNTDNEPLAYHYDLWKRMDSQTGAGRSYALAYDSYDRLQSLTYPDNKAVTYGYDALNRIASASYTDMGTVTPSYAVTNNENTYTIQYPNIGKQERKTDAFKELKSVQHVNTGNTTTWTEAFTYDGMGNIGAIARNGQNQSFTYDGLNRIKEETLCCRSFSLSGNERLFLAKDSIDKGQ